MKYDAYCFDLYGTLIDIRTDESDPALWAALAARYSAEGASWTASALQAAYQEEAGRQPVKDTACPEIDLAPGFAALYRRRGIEPSAAQIAETAWFFRRKSTSRLRLYAGVKELLAALRAQGKVILLSNAQHLFTMPELKRLGIDTAFDRIYISSDYGCKKPDPAFFALPLNEFGLLPERCLMIGNDPYCDADGARSVGMDAWCIRTAISPQDAAPDRFDQLRMNLKALQNRLC